MALSKEAKRVMGSLLDAMNLVLYTYDSDVYDLEKLPGLRPDNI